MSNTPNEGLQNKRHSLAHLLAVAVLELFPDTKLGIGPAIDNGFYYDFLFAKPLSADDLPAIEAKMIKLAKTNLGFERKKVTAEQAINFFSEQNQPFKLELVKDLSAKDEPLTLYQTGNFIDLCKGGHIDNTSTITNGSFKLDKLAGAYWKGDENNPMLTRIYGLAFETAEELSDYIDQRIEAEKRDHKKLGKDLDLFVFSDLVGAGLPLWTPNGTLLRNLLDDYVWELRNKYGYHKVEIPHITKKDLYEKSGHWQKFSEELFKITTREGHEFAMKPMNCPHHTQIYNRKRWSYRELPQRYANTTAVYRDEQSGELGGLSRVRMITQDDAHVFCRLSQVQTEVNSIWDIIQTLYSTFGFTDLSVRLSKRNPNEPEKYLGDDHSWQQAENLLQQVVQNKNIEVTEGIGEAAFYGPKLDFMAKDALDREHQVATIQLDFNQPERFNLFCINEEAKEERIVMIHAAIMGSIERFLSVLLEHTAGNFPLWLAPIQAMILPISEKHHQYVEQISKELRNKITDLRIHIDNRNESIGKRIREAVSQKIPYLLVAGEKEMENHTVAVRSRDGKDLGEIPIPELVNLFSTKIANRN